MSMAVIVALGILMPVMGVAAAYITVAATYWWETRRARTSRRAAGGRARVAGLAPSWRIRLT
ncbi:hypothetical protein AB0L82_31585 [Nocardia sp. NPDC052001]|uniref:hypothetical protein n=1 Tax=Nocardia sp. NPDC052001 TaxID=3154853 RepID=UPI0034405313